MHGLLEMFSWPTNNSCHSLTQLLPDVILCLQGSLRCSLLGLTINCVWSSTGPHGLLGLLQLDNIPYSCCASLGSAVATTTCRKEDLASKTATSTMEGKNLVPSDPMLPASLRIWDRFSQTLTILSCARFAQLPLPPPDLTYLSMFHILLESLNADYSCAVGFRGEYYQLDYILSYCLFIMENSVLLNNQLTS